MLKKLSFLFLLLIGALPQVQGQLVTGKDVAVTDTDRGQVRGYIHNGIYTYKGIPYGQAKRFATATKPEPWEGVRSSMTYGPVAPLLTPTTMVQDESEFVFDHDWGYTSENCLVLNVWTPAIKDGKKRPVMFWIHGGGFTSGSSQELPSYDGENLATAGDVVVVSINHRLNVLGFLDLSAYGPEFATSANNSILDMRLALEWVRDNIENFGGDPGNVTIFGQSGGGAKVNTLMAMPSAEGLFHKAINLSGAFRSDMPTKALTQRLAAETLKELGLTAAEAGKLQELPFPELSAASSRALATINKELKESGKDTGVFGLGWGPSVDGEVLPYQPYSAEATKLCAKIPLMIGTVKNEFQPFFLGPLAQGSEEEVMAYIKKTHGDRADAFIAAVKAAYPETTNPQDLINVDNVFRPGAVRQANLHSSAPGAAPVYAYLFTWSSPVLDGKYKSLHCMDLPFVFDNIDRCKNMTGGGEAAHLLADRMSKAWINFARTGNPNHKGIPQWPAYDQDKGATMMMDTKWSVRNHPDAALLKFYAEK
ncbi:carboxylesterase family protein [Neolewinella lacunae]|uniref:Carboxylic ester hydrolase n=1 Tax=Neolewinella lacunae TaxID=1517758 RepID=A0A923TDM6_9BACT|nr:carboxylesterase family protein [Neolewinella lacunae]MBC6995007.1 carboxylesterase/lipase family protein [Neolewinella lacunae]MDN3633222.1 carboxylesterase family protein [Neolewinella lacunae]